MAKHLFFLGKGGVGKSTLSSIEGIKSAKKGHDTLIVSLDPAHNQADIFQTDLNEKPHRIEENLQIIEINTDRQIKKYLHEIEKRLKSSYRYLTAFNLEDHFEIIRYSPAIEEYALLQAYMQITNAFKEKELIIFDMPPTALTLKFFNLPKLSLLWLDKLIKIREEIIGKKQIITKIKLAAKSFETDKIMKSLQDQYGFYNKINAGFRDRLITNIMLVLNPDKLSINESKRIMEQLQALDMHVDEIYINKTTDENLTSLQEFSDRNIKYIPLASYSLTGLQNLNNFIKQLG